MKLLAKFLNSQQISLLQKIGLDSQVESILQALKNFEINHDQASHQIKKLLDSSCQGSQETIDVHFGGEDHIETHHPNEILQAEAINLGCHLSRFWVHNKYLIVDGQKMSKSLGNVFLSVGKFENTGFYSFETPPVKSFSLDLKKAIIKKYKELKIFNLFSSEEAFWAKFTFSPLAYRLMLMEHSYTEQLNFTWQKLWQSTLRLWNLRKDISNLRFFYQDSNKNLDFEISEEAIQKPKKVLLSYLQDNLDTPKFLEKYQNLLSETVNHLRQEQKLNFTNLQTLKYFEDNLLQFNLFPEICSDLNNILEARQKARQQKNYQQSDSLRNQILKLGFQVEDYTWGSSVWLAI